MGTNLKKVGFCLFFAIFMAFSPLAMAKEVARQDLGVENTGILPSNPFYFFKEWGRGIRKALSFSPQRRAELALDIVNERAAEIAKLEELNVMNVDGFLRAATSYNDSLTELKARLDALKSAPLGDKFLDTLISRSMKHFIILDSLRGRFAVADGGADFDARLAAAERSLAAILALIPGVFEDAERFGARFVSIIGKEKGGWKDLIAVETLDRIEEAAAPAVKEHLVKTKDSLLTKVSAQLQAVYTSETEEARVAEARESEDALEDLPGDPLRRLKVLDEAREKITDPGAKNFVNIIRQRLLDAMKTANRVTRVDAQTMMLSAEGAIAEAQALLLQKRSVRPEVRAMLERARFNLDAAQSSAEDENYGNAFGQAATALAAAKSAFAELMLSEADYAVEVKQLKQYFDALLGRVKDVSVERGAHAEFFALLDAAEKEVGGLADLINKKAKETALAAALRSAKLKLATVEQMLQRVIAAETAAKEQQTVKRSEAAPRAAAQVSISGDQFVPSVLKVKKGTVVTWQNNDDAEHGISSDPHPSHDGLKGFDSGRAIAPGERYTFVFERRGSFKYHDDETPGMAGMVEVE